jgi:threonine dehydrogenase-like Zn-dependent dehydrogenase
MEARDIIRVPEHLPLAATAPVELAMCVGATVQMLRDRGLIRNRRVGVTGLGPAGLIAAQMARAEGATQVIGFDLSDTRREYALAQGVVDAAYNPTQKEDVNYFPVRPGTLALQCAIDCVGAKRSVEFLMDRTQETVALFGVQREDYTFAPRHYMHLTLCGYPGHSIEAARYAVDLLERGLLNLELLVTHHLPLSEYNKGVDLLERQEAIKVCFYPWHGTEA